MKKNKGGRPTKMTEITVKKLEEAFAMGCSDLEACLYANISKVTLYKYQDKNPEFINRKEQLKENPVLLARKTVVNDLDKTETAKWYLEKKRKKEFGTIQQEQFQQPNINILVFNDNNNPSQLQSREEAISIGSVKKPGKIQIARYTSESGEDSTESESIDSTGDAEQE